MWAFDAYRTQKKQTDASQEGLLFLEAGWRHMQH